MTFSDVTDNINSGVYKNKLDYPNTKNYPESYIFDADQTVKWNREQIAVKNAEIKANKDSYQKHERELEKKFEDDLKEAIKHTTGISEEDKINKIYNKAWEDGHSSGYNNVVYHAEELSDLIADILK